MTITIQLDYRVTTPDYSHMQKWELLRMVCFMPLEGSSSIFLLVAVQLLDAPAMAKAFIPASLFVGLLLSPGLLHIVAKLRVPVARAASNLYLLSAFGMLVVACNTGLVGFLVGVCLALMVPALSPPLITKLWQQNTPDHMRGTLFSRNFRCGLISKILLGLVIAWWLGRDIENYRHVCLAFAVLMVAAGMCFRQIESEPTSNQGVNPIKSMTLVFENRSFSILLFVWMLFGFANLATMPLRTEYLASGVEFPAYSPLWVVILIEVIPTTLRLLSVTLWGRMFDKVDFLIVRVLINITFALSIILFFVPSIVSQIFACALFGVASGGGSIVWNLWVTKYAPKEQTSEYMAVHTCLTGLRGIFAPFVAYIVLDSTSFSLISVLAFSLVCVSIVLVVGLIRWETRRSVVRQV